MDSPAANFSRSDTPGEVVWVIGQGYVGLPIAMAAVAAGYRVIGIDSNSARVASLLAGDSPTPDVSANFLAEALATGRYLPVDNYEEAPNFSVAVVTVPTPLKDKLPVLDHVKNAAASLGAKLSAGALVVLESTTYPGTTRELVLPLLEGKSGLKSDSDFFVGYSPERIDPGNHDWSLMNTPKLVAGVSPAAANRVEDFYCSLGIPTVMVSEPEVAELSKLLENTFRHVNIALVNELSRFGAALGVDIFEAVRAAATKPFGFMPFTPGPGVGGHCLPVDPSYLSWRVRDQTGLPFRFIDLANEVNGSMPMLVASEGLRLLRESGVNTSEAKVLLFGLAYKAGVGDTRESPSLAVAEAMRQTGVSVYGLDAFVPDHDWPPGVSRIPAEAGFQFDLGIVMTRYPNLEELPEITLCEKLLDTQNIVKKFESVNF